MGDYGTSQSAADANHSKLLCILFITMNSISLGDHVMHVTNKTRLVPRNSNLNCDTRFMSLYRKKQSVSKPPHETSTCILQHLRNIQKNPSYTKNHEKSQWLLLESSSKRSLRLLLFSILGSASSASGSSASRL